MRISIIPEDKKIIVDGKSVDLEPNAPWDFDDIHDGKQIHAIQWKDGYGELEYENIPGKPALPNKAFDESEFDTIVKPYVDFFNKFLTIYEQKQLESALKEEENIAKQIEELNLDKLEKEAQLVIIEDLQRQNKELRDEKDVLEEERSRLEQAEMFNQQTALMELEREKIARESEYSALEAQKAEEYFKNRAFELQKIYDSLYENFEKEKEAFIEERKKYQELLQKQRDLLELEKDDVYNLIEMNNKEVQKRTEELEQYVMLNDERTMVDKSEFEYQKQLIELEEQRLEKEKLDNQLSILQSRSNLELEQQFFDQQKKTELEFLLKEREDLFKSKEDLEQREENVKDLKVVFEETYEDVNKLKQYYKDKIFESRMVDNTKLLDIKNNVKNENSIEDVLEIIEQIDPEKLYTTLTSTEKNENQVFVDKAVKWFSALKEVLDKNT